jgi:hypothetical protein
MFLKISNLLIALPKGYLSAPKLIKSTAKFIPSYSHITQRLKTREKKGTRNCPPQNGKQKYHTYLHTQTTIKKPQRTNIKLRYRKKEGQELW